VGDAPIEVALALRNQLMAPLVLGGPMLPLRDVGAKRAQAVAQAALGLERDPLATRIDVGRSRQARRLQPIDAIDAPGLAEWLLIIALNDLVQATNPQVNGILASRGPQQLLRGVHEIIDRVSPAPDARDALARHATFARLFEVERLDTHVSWWCGAADFLGRRAPRRLLMLPQVRRVSVQQSPTDLGHMADAGGAGADDFLFGVQRLLELSPLTDLATAQRSKPAFVWTRAVLQLLAAPSGRSIGMRALRLNDPAGVLQVLRRARFGSTVAERDPLVRQAELVTQDLAAYNELQSGS